MLTRKGKIVVWSTLQTKNIILEWLHSSPQGGHSGIKATERRFKTLFYWKGLLRDIKDYITKCEQCLRCKYDTAAQPGLLQPLVIPNGVWHSIAMDFIDGLPWSVGRDAIWVIVDRLSKYAHFVALSQPVTAAGLAQNFMDQFYRLHGPLVILSVTGIRYF